MARHPSHPRAQQIEGRMKNEINRCSLSSWADAVLVP